MVIFWARKEYFQLLHKIQHLINFIYKSNGIAENDENFTVMFSDSGRGDIRRLKDGEILKYTSGIFSSKWKKMYAVLFSDSRLVWFENRVSFIEN